MGICRNCNAQSGFISSNLGFCLTCIRNDFAQIKSHLEKTHASSRRAFSLPEKIPAAAEGKVCKICGNNCSIGEKERGYCGLRLNKDGVIRHLGGTGKKGFVDWYYDPLPTNCVADWVCPEGTVKYGERESFLRRYMSENNNLAVFYEACSYNCLFCQNWHFKNCNFKGKGKSAGELANAVNDNVRCICYFGGDPVPQIMHAIAASEIAIKKAGDKTLRICWETNGNMNPAILRRITDISLKTGGCIKFDIKTFNENLSFALCGVSNKTTLSNFKWLSEKAKERKEYPLAVASTLLVPGYIDEEEIRSIASYIASINTDIPYSLLGFHPLFYLSDLPVTSKETAFKCKKIAEKAGLKKVKIGNLHLLK